MSLKIVCRFKSPDKGISSRSFPESTAKRLRNKSDDLLQSLLSVERIDSSAKRNELLAKIAELNVLLPTGARDPSDLCANHQSSLKRYAEDDYPQIIELIITKIGGENEELPAELIKLFTITDNLSFIVESMSLLSDAKLLANNPTFIVKLLEEMLNDETYLLFALARASRKCCETCCVQASQLIQFLINFPTKIANQLKASFPRTFDRQVFSGILMSNTLTCFFALCHINKLEKSKVYDFTMLSQLISKIVVNFNGDKKSALIVSAMSVLSAIAGRETHRSDVNELMKSLQRQAIEMCVALVLERELNKQQLLWLFGGYWKQLDEWRFVFMKKLPFLTFTDSDLFVDNLVFFLATEDQKSAEQLLLELLRVWGTKTHVMETPFAQHFYVTKLLVLLTRSLANVKGHSQEIKRQLLNGVQLHLGSTDNKLRAVGMITAEVIMGMLDSELIEEDKLKFEYHDLDAEAQRIVGVIRAIPERHVATESLTNEPPSDEEIAELMNQLQLVVQNKLVAEAKPQVTQQTKTSVPNKAPPQKQEEELDSDDDDLHQFDVDRREEKRPRYLLDLMEAFSTNESLEDGEKFEVSFTSAVDIIRQQLPNHHSDIGVDLLTTFVHLDKMCYFENFDEMKMEILTTIMMIYPKEGAQYLCQEFNRETIAYSVSRRQLMLNVLAETAKKLSHLENPKKEVEVIQPSIHGSNKLLLKLRQELQEKSKKDAKRIIQERLAAKTRRIASRTSDDKAGINQFGSVAGYFFFPLVQGFGKKQMTFKTGTNLLYDSDNLLLIHYINTLAILMLCAENSPVAPKMAKEIINLSVFLRYHQESRIRLSVLHMVATVLMSVPRNVLTNDFSLELNEFLNHLDKIVKSTVINYEPDQECRAFAKQLMAMCQQALFSSD